MVDVFSLNSVGGSNELQCKKNASSILSTFQAVRAKYEGRSHDEAWHLLKAGRWNESHQILLRHVAPDAIINGTY